MQNEIKLYNNFNNHYSRKHLKLTQKEKEHFLQIVLSQNLLPTIFT